MLKLYSQLKKESFASGVTSRDDRQALSEWLSFDQVMPCEILAYFHIQMLWFNHIDAKGTQKTFEVQAQI